MGKNDGLCFFGRFTFNWRYVFTVALGKRCSGLFLIQEFLQRETTLDICIDKEHPTVVCTLETKFSPVSVQTGTSPDLNLEHGGIVQPPGQMRLSSGQFKPVALGNLPGDYWVRGLPSGGI